ncbi:hypothetical protein ACO2JO_01085 [Leptospira interrogans]
MAKMLTLVTSILARLLSVSAVLPWIAGMAIALISVWDRIRQRRIA